MAKNEITSFSTEVTEYKGGTKDLLNELIAKEVGLSPLAVGTKFSTDDLLSSPKVHLSAYDWVDYIQNEGTPDEKEVHFALWAVTAMFENKKTGEVYEEDGYYQGGFILNKIARAIERNNALDDFNKFGLDVSFEKDKTSSGNPIVLVKVLGE